MTLARRDKRRLLGAALSLPVLVGLGWVGDTFITRNNFRVVSADLFRSGQLRPDQWRDTLDGTHYRSVLNLRGAAPDRGWYQQEVRFAADHGLEHYDVALSASRAPSVDQMKTIIDTMKRAPKPLLIHCMSGSDRSGLVAALYQLAIAHSPESEADRQLSLWYGHFPWLGRTGAMQAALDTYITAFKSETTTVSRAEGLP